MALWGCFTELCRSPTTSAFSYRLKSRRAGVIVVPTCQPFRGLVFLNKDVLDELTINGMLGAKVVRYRSKETQLGVTLPSQGPVPSVTRYHRETHVARASINSESACPVSRRGLLWKQCDARSGVIPTAEI